MIMRTLLFAVCATAALCVCAFAQVPGAPVTGTITWFDAKTITLSAADGAVTTAQVTPGTRIILNVKKTVADIKPGDFIASGGTRGPDGKLRANEIRIFSAAGAPGSANCPGRAADAPGGAGTGCLGETEFEVPADVPIVAQVPGDASIL